MTTTSPPLAAPPARITVVTAPACHFCRDALDALDDLGRDFRLQIVELDARTADGSALMQRHRAAMSPLVLLDDVFLSAGRLPRNKLRKHLAARASQAAVAR